MQYNGSLILLVVFGTFLCTNIRADVSELLNNQNKTHQLHHHHHHDHHNKDDESDLLLNKKPEIATINMNLKDLQEIKFSLNVILRELKFLMSHPVFESIKADLDKSLVIDMNEKSESVLSDVMTRVEEKLDDLEHIDLPNYASDSVNVGDNKDEDAIKYEAPDRNLSPPSAKVTTFGTVIDNFWLNDGFQSADASSKILVAISPVLRAPSLDKEFFRRNKRALNLPLIDPLALNDELMSKLVFRRAIANDSPYNYDRPIIKFQEGASAVNEDKEYLPPLETSADTVNTVKQPFSKETGYEYKKPQRPFNLPSETVTVRTVVTTRAPIKIQEKEYLPPFEGSSANNVPKFVQTTTTTKKPEYLPPLETSAAIINTVKQPFSKETGYEYKRPEKPFNLPNDNSITLIDVRSSNNVPKIIQTTKSPENDYLPPLEPSSANNIPTTISKDDGYSYPKPSRPFPPLEPSPSNTVRPQTLRPTETTTTTTRRPIIISTTTEKEYLPPKYEASNSDGGKIQSFEPPKQKYDPINGYDYSKPAIKFETGLDASNTNDAPSRVVVDYPKQKYDPINGYDYAKPSIKFETGVEKDYLPPKSRQSKGGIQVISLGGYASGGANNNGRDSVYDKLNPVNRLSEDILALARNFESTVN